VETPDGNRSKGVRQLNGVYTRRFNRRQNRVGHLFEGRFKAILVERDTYLLELSRYEVLNPVRAAMVAEISGRRGAATMRGWVVSYATLARNGLAARPVRSL
jgi:hypothetical protein